jgi:hypothetical protein
VRQLSLCSYPFSPDQIPTRRVCSEVRGHSIEYNGEWSIIVTLLSYVLQLPLQHERKIRNVDLIMFWFVSRGSGPIEKPLRLGVRFTDLYLHLHGESEVQIWIWNRDNAWEAVE